MQAPHFFWIRLLACLSFTGSPSLVRAQPVPIAGVEYALATHPVTELTALRQLDFKRLEPSGLPRGPFPDSVESVWLRYTITNVSAGDSIRAIHSIGRAPLIYLYQPQGDKLAELGKTGYELPYSLQSIRGDERRILFSIPASADQTFYIRFRRYHDELEIFLPVLQKKELALSESREEETRGQSGKTIQFFLSGFFLAIAVYSLLKFFSLSRDKVYLLYALVNVFCCLGTTVYYNVPNFESSLFPWLRNNKEICSIFSDLTIVLTYLFFLAIMDVRAQSKTLYHITRAYIVFHLIVTILIPIWASGPGNIVLGRVSSVLYPVCEILCLMLDFLFVLYLWRRRTGFYRYLFYGCCIMTFGMLLFTLSSVFSTHKAYISKSGSVSEYIIMAFFISSEVWFFIMALTQREKQTEMANARYQEQLIAQLSENKRVQENFTRDLELLAAERSEQIVQQQKLLEQEREDKLLAVFNRRIFETELKALRSQMNPHFIFNSLNSIENFMMNNDKKMASDYFGKFALLIRRILESSDHEIVPFAKDMESLQLYVDLEQLRFDYKFSYRTIIDPVLLAGDYNVPPLLIQPYVENAIIHGLSQSDKEGLTLLVSASLTGGYIMYDIQDNGIGRRQAARYRRHNKSKAQSMGIEITQQRINIFNQQQGADGEVVILDLYDPEGVPTGTRVQVKLKAI